MQFNFIDKMQEFMYRDVFIVFTYSGTSKLTQIWSLLTVTKIMMYYRNSKFNKKNDWRKQIMNSET